MKYIVAVSGGVDSVVLLDILYHKTASYKVRPCNNTALVVAHFDHGIRPDSADDARFVGELAGKYDLPFENKREELGADASEELARTRRYAFLRELAAKHQATIATAHHLDDLVETVAINLVRGTGWRGLAVLDSDIYRPLLDVTKQEIKEYAKSHQLIWREDSTNADTTYLRNRLRRQTMQLPLDTKRQIAALRATQCDLKCQIKAETERLVGNRKRYDRYFFIQADTASALECLYYVTHGRLTRPQLARALMAIKLFKPGRIFQAGGGVKLGFTSRHFTVEVIK